MKVSEIIDLLGGDTSIAREIGVPLTTVNAWKRHNSVPEWRKPKLLELAMTRDVSLSTGDFPPRDERIDPRRAAA